MFKSSCIYSFMSFACLISDKFLSENGKFYLEFTLDERFLPALTSIAKLGIGTFSLELENWGVELTILL